MSGGSDVAKSTLSCAQCGKPANLQCPKYVELKLPSEGAAFCTQDCFKASWSSHKSIHLKAKLSSLGSTTAGEQNSATPNDDWLYCVRKGLSQTPKLPNFDWTGTLKPYGPYPISKLRIVPSHVDLPDWAIDGIPKIEPKSDLQHVVEIKTPEQIDKMRETCRIAREVLDAAARVIRPGVTTDEIDAVVHEATIAASMLQDLATQLTNLWNLMDTSEEERSLFDHVTCNKSASVDEVTIPGALALDLINQAEVEVERLQLKACRMKEVAFKRQAELKEIYARAHIEIDTEAARGKIIALIDYGNVERSELLADMDNQIIKAKEKALSRKYILDKVEKWMSACEEKSWLEDYNRVQRKQRCALKSQAC